jgi:hypothetical protein
MRILLSPDRRLAELTLLVLLIGTLTGSESAADPLGEPEQIYRKDCAVCHREPARDFLAKAVTRSAGRFTTKKTKADLRAYLGDHFRKRSKDEISAIMRFIAEH